jgi:hypothetical protein
MSARGKKDRPVAEEVGRLYNADGPDLPPSLSSLWEATANPFWAWEKIGVCCRMDEDFPDWVRKYLGECAERMTSPDAARERDLRRALPGILGFKNTRGAGHLLNPSGINDACRNEYAEMALKFAREIKDGAKPTAALATARVDYDPDVEDRTMLRHIKRLLGVIGNPRTKAEWRAALRHWF